MAERIGERRERRARRAATITMVALTLAVLSALAVGLSGPAHRFGLLGTRWAIGVFGVAGLASLAAAALALVGLVLALASRAWRSVAGTALALVLALAAAGPPLVMARTGAKVPLIHDITTDTGRPPQWVALRPQRATAENGAAYGGAPVATPLHWEELGDRRLRPDCSMIETIGDRLSSGDDPWRRFRGSARALPRS